MDKRMYVKIKSNFEGYHKWSKAPDDISFLRNLHRHIFYVIATIEVFEDDREIEFFQCKRFIKTVTSTMLVKLGDRVSCEQMAEYLRYKLHLRYSDRRYVKVEVNEDNENGSIVEDKV